MVEVDTQEPMGQVPGAVDHVSGTAEPLMYVSEKAIQGTAALGHSPLRNVSNVLGTDNAAIGATQLCPVQHAERWHVTDQDGPSVDSP